MADIAETTRFGYGDQKQWYWMARSDIPTTASKITSGTVYLTPWTMDTPMIFNPVSNRFRFKYTYDITDPLDTNGAWTINMHIGVYKLQKGTTGASNTLALIRSSNASWQGNGAASATVYDWSAAVTVAITNLGPVMDGMHYVAMLWTWTLGGAGMTALLSSYGRNTSSGAGFYATGNTLTGQTSLPATVAALSGTAKTFQEHWIIQF